MGKAFDNIQQTTTVSLLSFLAPTLPVCFSPEIVGTGLALSFACAK